MFSAVLSWILGLANYKLPTNIGQRPTGFLAFGHRLINHPIREIMPPGEALAAYIKMLNHIHKSDRLTKNQMFSCLIPPPI
jgi:hypothetical protein